MAKKILFILDDYPTKKTNGCVFVKNIIIEMTRIGVECTVIAPRIFSPQNIKRNDPYMVEEIEDSGSRSNIRIYRPWYLHLSSGRWMMRLSMHNHYSAVMKTIKRERLQPDILYGHFIYQNGISVSKVGKKLGIPAYCAVGENSNRIMKHSEPYETGLRYGKWKRYLDDLNGIISVSEYNAKLLVENGFVRRNMNILVSPNGIDHDIFFPIDQKEARRKLNIPQECFVVAFTGAFSERKGVLTLCEALDKCDDVYSIFMGAGSVQPNCKNILWCGSVMNQELKYYLNAADVFVLPTSGEGCCNAIIEALACGLPVISSNLPFNDGILNESNSIKIDRENPNEIVNAILKLKNDTKLRNQLSQGAILSSSVKSNQKRAQDILDFIGRQ